ncbi:MAG: hypothetical protein IIA85_00995 [Nanoarchaeota archaeon]|nr:hypothetical protein [Nanoarchaeota archaeon]
MEKRDTKEILSKEDIFFLNQLIKSLEESELKLEEYYNKKDYENFNNLKKLMISVSNKISEVIK